jgi:citronellol/citronellal dehydrogenase
MKSLTGKTAFITGASRGIGRAIALHLATHGANIVIVAKSTEENPRLAGTIYSVAAEVEALGAEALAIAVDVRDEAMIQAAVEQAVAKFGGIDMLINNASAIGLTDTATTSLKRYDLMMSVNVRATFACAQACLPYLAKATNPHILTLSPPLHMDAKWFKNHVAYTMSKYGMSMCTLGMAQEFKALGIGVNSLWPKTIIATAAIAMNFPKELMAACRKPEIVADAAFYILTSDAKQFTGHFCIDEDVLISHGSSDFEQYAVSPGTPLYPDLFLD